MKSYDCSGGAVMKGWYRALVAAVALTAILCTSAAGYAGYKLLGREQLLSNEALIRVVSDWWSENAK